MMNSPFKGMALFQAGVSRAMSTSGDAEITLEVITLPVALIHREQWFIRGVLSGRKLKTGIRRGISPVE